jgi:hypothetical protein
MKDYLEHSACNKIVNREYEMIRESFRFERAEIYRMSAEKT